MNVLVNGIGNIGATLLSLLIKYKDYLGVEQIYAHKRIIQAWQESEINDLKSRGVLICTSTEDNLPDFEKILPKINYLFETTPNGVGLMNKAKYKELENLIGVSAQGSEKGFGIPFMMTVNEEQIKNKKFVQVVSCNTHGTAALLKLFAGNQLEDLENADMVVVRRSEDIGNHERLVSGNVVSRHLDDKTGTHHAVDVNDLFETVRVECNLTSSDITTPSQLMHAVRFNIKLKTAFKKQQLGKRINANNFISTTQKFDSNVIFELGRRKGFKGRIYSHAIVVENNLLISGQNVKGWAFVPQEGNTILSTIHSFLLQTNHNDESAIMKKLIADLCFEQW